MHLFNGDSKSSNVGLAVVAGAILFGFHFAEALGPEFHDIADIIAETNSGSSYSSKKMYP